MFSDKCHIEILNLSAGRPLFVNNEGSFLYLCLCFLVGVTYQIFSGSGQRMKIYYAQHLKGGNNDIRFVAICMYPLELQNKTIYASCSNYSDLYFNIAFKRSRFCFDFEQTRLIF